MGCAGRFETHARIETSLKLTMTILGLVRCQGSMRGFCGRSSVWLAACSAGRPLQLIGDKSRTPGAAGG